MSSANNIPYVRTSFRIALTAALALLPLIAMNNALACAACGCTLSKDWGTQGVITTPGVTADLSYDYVRINAEYRT